MKTPKNKTQVNAQTETKPLNPEANIRKFCHYDFVILREIDSPIHRRLIEISKSEKQRRKMPVSEEDVAELVFQFTRPCREVKEILKSGGREQFRTAAVQSFERLAKNRRCRRRIAKAAIREIVIKQLHAFICKGR